MCVCVSACVCVCVCVCARVCVCVCVCVRKWKENLIECKTNSKHDMRQSQATMRRKSTCNFFMPICHFSCAPYWKFTITLLQPPMSKVITVWKTFCNYNPASLGAVYSPIFYLTGKRTRLKTEGGSGVMRSAANSHVKIAKVSRRVPAPIQVYGDRDLITQKLRSKPASLFRHGAREKSGILNINTSIF